jgi:hypothetical protein
VQRPQEGKSPRPKSSSTARLTSEAGREEESGSDASECHHGGLLRTPAYTPGAMEEHPERRGDRTWPCF